MNKIILKSLNSTLISLSPLIIYIIALLIAPEKTDAVVSVMREFVFGFSQEEIITTMAVLGVVLAALAFYDLYWKVQRNRKKIAISMPFKEVPSGKVYKQIYADMDKEMSIHTKRLTDIVFEPESTDTLDPDRFKFLLHLIVGFREKNPEILEDLNTYCEEKYRQLKR